MEQIKRDTKIIFYLPNYLHLNPTLFSLELLVHTDEKEI